MSLRIKKTKIPPELIPPIKVEREKEKRFFFVTTDNTNLTLISNRHYISRMADNEILYWMKELSGSGRKAFVDNRRMSTKRPLRSSEFKEATAGDIFDVSTMTQKIRISLEMVIMALHPDFCRRYRFLLDSHWLLDKICS